MEKVRALIHTVLGPSKTAPIERAIVTLDDFAMRPLMAMLAYPRARKDASLGRDASQV